MSIGFHDFNLWRDKARSFLEAGITPANIQWTSSTGLRLSFNNCQDKKEFFVTKEFLKLAETVCVFRDNRALDLLYRVLWRINHGEKLVIFNLFDKDILELNRMSKSVKRDIHKMHAFVRFKRLIDNEGEKFIAWHRPDHYILRVATPFFVRRFGSMRWEIQTPDESATYDGKNIKFHSGVLLQPNISDITEENWKIYYRAIFNPARIKLKAMKNEMPVRHWQTLPETEVISRLIAEAPARLQKMAESSKPRAEPRNIESLNSLRKDALHCKACPLHKGATQTVFGEGPQNARIVFVGEQPGEDEDLSGRPFVGPAGKLFDKALKDANIDRSKVYITNSVKHFKFELSAEKRIHINPNGSEIGACRPWLLSELQIIKPKVIVCLGASAAQSVLGNKMTIAENRKKKFSVKFASCAMITFHPSALLRIVDTSKKEKIYFDLVDDLKAAAAATSL